MLVAALAHECLGLNLCIRAQISAVRVPFALKGETSRSQLLLPSEFHLSFYFCFSLGCAARLFSPRFFLPLGSVKPRFLVSTSSLLVCKSTTAMKRILAKLRCLKRRRICPVCCNLDPYNVPNKYDRETVAWAPKEVQRATHLHSSTVEIDGPQPLIQRAASGCPYCRLVSDALSKLHTGWDDGPSSIDLMLGADLPLVVRLNPGRRWREGTDFKFWAKPRKTDPRAVEVICTHTVRELGTEQEEGQEGEQEEEQPEPDDIEIYVPRTPQSVAGIGIFPSPLYTFHGQS